MIQQLITIGRNTLLESIRQPFFTVLVITASLALMLNPMLAAYTLDDDSKLMIDMGLSTIFITGLFLAAFTASSVISTEIENKTVLSVVSKPVARPVFVLGKFLGVATAIASAFTILGIMFLLTVRHKVMQTASDGLDGPVLLFGGLAWLTAIIFAVAGNYYYRRVFTSNFIVCLMLSLVLGYVLVLVVDPHWQFQPVFTELMKDGGQLAQIIVGMLMIFEAILILAAVAVACSTRLGQVMTLVICAGLFMLGLVSDYFFGRFEQNSKLLAVFYRMVPNMQFLWPADALTQGHSITLSHLGWISSYCLLYVTGILSLAVALFQTREVG